MHASTTASSRAAGKDRKNSYMCHKIWRCRDLPGEVRTLAGPGGFDPPGEGTVGTVSGGGAPDIGQNIALRLEKYACLRKTLGRCGEVAEEVRAPA